MKMSHDPPFSVPDYRKSDESFQDRVEHLNKLREEAKARLAKRYTKIKPRRGRWSTGEDMRPPLKSPKVI